MNSVNISGRLTKDPELKTTQSNIPVCSFGVAVDRPGVKDKSDFIDCVAWRNTAEFVSKYFAKGDPIEITGTLTTRNREDQNGTRRKSVEVVCDHVGFPKQKPKQDGEQPAQDYGQTDYAGDFEEIPDDDFPPF